MHVFICIKTTWLFSRCVRRGLLQYTLLEGSSVMWQNLRDAHQHPNIARHFWAVCRDSTVTVCIDFNSVAGDFFHSIVYAFTDVAGLA